MKYQVGTEATCYVNPLNPEESVVKVVELRFTVDRDGRVDEVTSPTTDVPEAIVKNSMASMKRSRYAPRIENGMAVPTRAKRATT